MPNPLSVVKRDTYCQFIELLFFATSDEKIRSLDFMRFSVSSDHLSLFAILADNGYIQKQLYTPFDSFDNFSVDTGRIVSDLHNSETELQPNKLVFRAILVRQAGETRTQKIIGFIKMNIGVLNESQNLYEIKVSSGSTSSDFSCYYTRYGFS